MRIESIEITNYRQYRHEVFRFPKKNGRKDVHIIIGENGEGKTNILNALTWCLYGEELHLGDKNTAIKSLNSQYTQELRKAGQRHGEASVIVEMSIENGGNIRFMRTSTFSITERDVIETKQDVTAFTQGRGGVNIIDNKDEYKMYVSRYVPREISEYIFFDGELMDQYFKSDKRANIEAGIKDLTKASSIEKTRKALFQYSKSDIAPQLKRYGDDNVAKAQADLEAAQVHRENQQNKLGVIYKQAELAKQKVEENTAIIRGHENLKEKTDRLAKLEEESDSLKRRLADTSEQLMNFVREYYVYISFYPAIKSLYNYIQTQEQKGNLPPKVDKNLIQSIVDSKECAICGSKLNTEALQHVLEILHKLEVSSVTSAELNRASSALHSILEKMDKYQQLRKTVHTAHMEAKRRIEKNEEEYRELSLELKEIPNTEDIRKAIIDREHYSKEYDECKQRIGREQYMLEVAIKEVTNAEKALNKAMEQNSLLAVFHHQLDFCTNGIKILDETIEEILKECREEMEGQTFDIFDKLVWKEGAFSKVNILEDYTFELLDAYGNQTLGSCSAAERALLALSFTIALQQTSGHDSLLYIDTPLGRVGEKNRINFTKVLVDIARSKQVILSFTPTEYDSNVREQMANQYSSYCELKYDGGTTTINK